MLFWTCLTCIFLQNFAFSQTKEPKEACPCKVASLAHQDQAAEAYSCFGGKTDCHSRLPSFQGRQLSSQVSPDCNVPTSPRQRCQELEVWKLQNPEQEECDFLPVLWRTLGKGLCGRGHCLGMEPSRWILQPEATQYECKKAWTIHSPAHRWQRQRQGQRQGEGQGEKQRQDQRTCWRQGNWPAPIAISVSVLAFNTTLAGTGCGFPLCSSFGPSECIFSTSRTLGRFEKSLHRVRYATGREGAVRASRNFWCKAGDQRPSHCNDHVGQIPESAQGRTTAASNPSGILDRAPHRIDQDLGGSVGGLPEKADVTERSRAKGRSGHQICSHYHPTAQPGGRNHGTTRCRGSAAGGDGRDCRQRGAAIATETPADFSELRHSSGYSAIRNSFRWRSRRTNEGQTCKISREGRQGDERRWKRRSDGRPYCSVIMTMGCFFTCPEVKGGSVEPCQHQSNPVEAYCGDPLCFHSAASSIVLSPDPWHRNDWEDFTTPFDAVRHAMILRAQVLQDVWMQKPFPLSMQRSSSLCKHGDRRKSTVGFNENVELIIVLDGECKVNIQTSFTHEQLIDWVTKPWTLRKNEVDDTALSSHPVECWTPGVPCRNRTPQTNFPAIETLSQVEVGLVDNDCPKSPSWHNCSIDATSFTPLRCATYAQPHVFDRWCVASSGHSQRDESLVGDPLTEIPDGPRREVHLRSEDLSLPLAYTFASALDAADQDRVITSFRGDSITLISFGHKLHYLEQRTVQLRAQDFHKWRECLRTLWADCDDGTFFAIHNIIPPPVLGRSTVSTIIQLAPISVHASLVLLQFVPSSPPPEDPFVEIIPAISMRRNVFQACGQHLVLEPTAIVKQGFRVWHTGVPQQVQSGAFLRILIDDFPEDAVSLTQSFTTDISLVGESLIKTARLLGEHRLPRIEPSQDQQDQTPAARRLPPQGPAGTTRLYPWHMWEHFFNNPQEQGDHGVSLTIYGLALEPIETTFTEMRELSRTQLFRAVRSMYPAYSTWNLRIHMVCPQPVDATRRTHILAEFLPQGHAGLGNLCPVVTEVRWYQHTGLRHEMRAALYRPTPTACNLLLDDLEPRSLPRGDLHCSIWSRGLPCVVDQTITLHRGDFIQIRLMPEWSSDLPTGNFLGAEDFYRYGLTVTHWSSTGEIPLHFLTVDGQQHDSALSSFDTLTIDAICRRAENIWGPHALATFVRDRSDITGGWYFVISDLHTDGVPLLVERRIRNANGRTFHQFSALIWHSGQTLRQLIHDNFDATWSHDSDNRFVFVNQSPLPQDQLDLDFRPTPGTLVTVYHTAEEVTPLALPVSYEEARDDPIEDDEQFLLQRTVNSVGQLQVEVNSASGTLLGSIEECVQCKPNGDILPDHDSRVRYQLQQSNGERVPGIILAPPNWDRQPALLYAADHGAVRRDASQRLLVYVRSWFLPHDRYGSRLSKDCTIPAQLLFRLLDRLRNVWRQELLPNDLLQLRVVSPTPAALPNEYPRLHVILECNRPRTSIRRAILLTFQDLQPDGPSPTITWIPFLAPPMLTLQIIADVAVQPCDSRHLIVLAGTPDRRWMTEQDAREVQHGLYLPVLRDVQRRFPTQRLEIEETSMMQSRSTRRNSRSPRRSEGITPSSTHSSSSTFLVHAFRMSREHRLLTFDRASDRTYVEQLTTAWEVPVHHNVIELHTVNSPPQDLELSADSTFLVEFTADRQRQADPSDRLVLVDVTFTSADSRSTAANLRRTLWARCFMSREDVLHLLSSSSLCRLTTISCTVHLNHRVWPSEDTVHRQLMHGDYLHLVITGPTGVPTNHIQLAACEREAADSQRYIYGPSPSPSPDRLTPIVEQDESDDEEDDGEVSVSLLQKTACVQRAQAIRIEHHPDKPVRTPLSEITNTLALDAPRAFPSASQPDMRSSSDFPHVDDRWCESHVELRVPDCPAAPRRISLSDSIPASPEVVVPCSHSQFIRNQLLQLDLGTPGTISQLVKWHSATQVAFEDTPAWLDELPISYEFYTDGSSAFLDSSRRGAAAVILVVNTISGPRFGGTHCFHVDDPATAPRAEIVAMLGAILWAIELAGRHPSTTPHFCFGFDNTLAGNAAAGHWSPSCHLDIQACIRSLCHWMQARFGDDVFEWSHIKAHSGHPWNEAADALSWAAVAQWVPVQPLLERLPDLLLVEHHPGAHEWLWLLEQALQSRPGAPRVDLSGFHFCLDQPFARLPNAEDHPLQQRQQNAVAGPRASSVFTLRCCTANVLTLQSRGLGARAEHLAEQFLRAEIHCVGLQETRSHLAGHHSFNEFHVLSAPSAKGVGGIQFWIRRTWPTEHGTLQVQPSDLRILASTSRRLIVCLRHPDLHLLFVVCHAPSDGDITSYDDYWQITSRSIPAAYKNWRQIYLADANARVGEITSDYIGGFGAMEENPAGSCFHQWLTTQSLVAPQTFEAHHQGSHFTWTHADGEHRARLDYILVDSDLYSKDIRTWVSQDVDLSLDRADHQCVCADIPVRIWPRRLARKPPIGTPPSTSANLPGAIPWSADIHSHAAQVQHWLASQTPSKTLAQPRKKHLSVATWQAVQCKKYHFKRYSWCKKDFAKQTLAAVFHAWRNPSAFPISAPSPSVWRKLCDHSIAFHAAMAQRFSRQVTRGVRADDKAFYEGLAQRQGAIAADEGLPSFWKSIKPLLPKSRKKQRSNIRCTGPEPSELCTHYNQLEAGFQCDYSSLLLQCFHRQKQAVSEAPLQMALTDLPSRQEVERAGHRQKKGRAPGVDGVPAEVVHCVLPYASDILTTLFLKAWILGAEPVQFKGGLMHSIAKKSGVTTASGMRGIVLLDSVGKLYHSILRSRLIQAIPSLPSQLGGYRGQQTLFATQLLRSHCLVTSRRHLSTATVFVDVRSAFHCLLREHAFGTRGTFPPRLLAILQSEELDVHALAGSIPQHASRFLEHASPGLARAVQDAHQDTWYVLPNTDTCFATTRGSRPGSPLADIAFNILMSSLLEEIEVLIREHDFVSGVWDKLQLPSPVVAWMDDVAFPISVPDASQLDPAIERLMPRIKMIFESFGLRLNMAARKTEVVCQYRGRCSPQLRAYRFVECLGQFQLPDGSSLRAVPTYEHLGTMFAQSSTVQAEIHTRIGKATAAYREMAKPIFGNKHIPVRTRLQLLESLVIPVLVHGCGTWPTLTERQFQKINHVIIMWQRKIANDGFWSANSSSDWEFQARWKRIPLGLRLAKHRLLYALKLVRFAPQLVLDYITAENDLCQDSWLQAVTSAINWLIPREKPAPRDPDDEAPPPLLRPDSEVVIAWLAHHQSSGATSLRRAIARYLQEEHMMEMVHVGHKKTARLMCRVC